LRGFALLNTSDRAAHGGHRQTQPRRFNPIAGQGLNLACASASQLAEVLASVADPGRPPSLLGTYQRSAPAAANPSGVFFTDLLASAFADGRRDQVARGSRCGPRSLLPRGAASSPIA
jgi:2-polyprenyl-6-methoxyphenol hydroxylase-like FAD-dependent oxidoreductase